jgi:hypothetical protein
MEHRWSERRKIRARVTVGSRPNHAVATLRDISIGGTFIEMSASLVRLHTRVILRFTLPRGQAHTRHRLYAMVVRTAARGVALMFVDNEPASITGLREALASANDGTPSVERPVPSSGNAHQSRLVG